MKKVLVSLSVLALVLVPSASFAFPAKCDAYCHVYHYPDGSYWVSQRAAQAAYQAIYNATYGKGGLYCILFGYNC